MIHFIFSKDDLRYLFLKYDKPEEDKIMQDLKDWMNLTDPICYLTSWKGAPFTQDFLFEYVQPSGEKVYYCAIGLWQVIYMYFRDNEISYDGLIENQDVFKIKIKHTFEEFKNIVDSWNLKFPPRDYQYDSAYKILSWRQSTSQIATRAGKTLIAYIVFRYSKEYMGVKNILAIVPSIDLVKQMYGDFNEYKEFFKTECIWSGGKLVQSADFTVGTFQSLIKFLDKKSKKYNPHFFDKFDLMFIDETHRASGAQIRTIINHTFMKGIKLCFGMSGTLPKEHTIPYYAIHALLGAKIQDIKPKELMDQGYISNIFINQIRLQYKSNKLNKKQKKLFIGCCEYGISDYVFNTNSEGKREKILLDNGKFLIKYKKKLPDGVNEMKEMLKNTKPKEEYYKEYIGFLKKFVPDTTKTNGLVIEKMMTHFMNERIDYLCDKILPTCDRNTLILAHHTEYINYITEIIKKKFPYKHIDIITGNVKPKKRDEVKQMLKDNDDCILIASYGCLSTGITLNNLCFGVLFESFKSEIVNMQSLGRGLAKAANKEVFTVFDIIDCFNTDYATNKIFLQGLSKIKLYKSNQYPFKIINVNL